jgi:hypothetical protein
MVINDQESEIVSLLTWNAVVLINTFIYVVPRQ